MSMNTGKNQDVGARLTQVTILFVCFTALDSPQYLRFVHYASIGHGYSSGNNSVHLRWSRPTSLLNIHHIPHHLLFRQMRVHIFSFNRFIQNPDDYLFQKKVWKFKGVMTCLVENIAIDNYPFVIADH